MRLIDSADCIRCFPEYPERESLRAAAEGLYTNGGSPR